MNLVTFQRLNREVDQHRGTWRDLLKLHRQACAAAIELGQPALSELLPRLFRRATDERSLYGAWLRVKLPAARRRGPTVSRPTS